MIGIDPAETAEMTPASLRSELLALCAKHPDFSWLTIIKGSFEEAYTLDALRMRIMDHCGFYRQRGVREGDTVLIIAKESLDLFAGFFAAILRGALPAYFAYPSPKQTHEAFLMSLRTLVDHNDVRLVVGYTDVVKMLTDTRPISSPGFLGYFSHEGIPRGAGDWEEIKRFPEPNEEAFLQFSSGTTGAKKAVKIPTRTLFNQIRAYANFVRYDETSKVASWLPHYHDMGLIACMLMPIFKRVPIYMMSPFEWVGNPGMLLETITRHRCTHVWLPNFALGHLTRSVSAEEAARYDLSTVRQLVCCSEPVLHETVDKFVSKFTPCGLMEDVIRNCYAMAENTFAVTSTRQGPIRVVQIDENGIPDRQRTQPRDAKRTFVSAGVPLSNTRIKIVDAEGGECASGRTGEILIQSDCLIDGYHNNPGATQDSFSQGWFKTGDLGFLHDGELYVTGRKKDLIIIGGENIYPQDIEAILNDEPSLIPGRNVAFGIDDERLGTQRIVILAETAQNTKAVDTLVIQQKIMDALRVPISEFILLEPKSLRKSTAGKVSRSLNKTAYLDGAFSHEVQHMPAPDPEDLREIVRSVRPGISRFEIDMDTPLLSTGLIDSFDFVTLVGLLEEKYGLRFPSSFRTTDRFASLREIERTIQEIRNRSERTSPVIPDASPCPQWFASLRRLETTPRSEPHRPGWAEWCVNHLSIRASFLVRCLLKLAGVQVGRNVTFLGRVKIKLRGKPANIIIGDDVIIGHNVDLRNRENGRIILRDKVYLDDGVRIVAARDGTVDIGTGTEIGYGTVMNSGGDITIGRFAMIAGLVNINSSSHGTQSDQFIKEQPHSHGKVTIGDDVWIGSGASVIKNTHIGSGAVISSNALVSGEIPPFAICAGVPATVLRYR